MSYFVTGGTGFIGRHLVDVLLRRGGTVHVLVREQSWARLDELRRSWGADDDRVVGVVGDLSMPRLGVPDDVVDALRGEVEHFFHLAALYDMTADTTSLQRANVEGTRHVLELVHAIEAGHLHHTSSIAAAGRYRGVFREDMFEEAEGLEDAYFRTKHESEGIVRRDCRVPWRVYRPGVVVGNSTTGEMDKIDGPYYFFKLIQKIRHAFPEWVPLVGIEGGPINLVPVDFVARALDHIAHLEGLDGKTFHLVDPDPKTVAQAMNDFARAAHAPEFAMRVEAKATNLVPPVVRTAIASIPPVQRVVDGVLEDLGIPRRVIAYADQPTRFDCREARAALAGSGIAVPRLDTYADKLWDYWERNLDPDLFRDRSLRGALEGKRVLITGASTGIGRATAIAVGGAGAEVILVARSADKLAEVAAVIEEAGGTAHVHSADLSKPADCDRLVAVVIAQHGGVDVLVNNAGRSIRRSLALSEERFHDFERTMQLNYFGALKLILGFVPGMRERKDGQIINVSSIGVQTNPPRFSAYVASKAALDAFSRCAASELIDDGVKMTTVYMPLVKTEMTAPTKIYEAFPMISAEEASQMITGAMIDRPKRVSTRLGVFGQIAYATAPKVVDVVLNVAYRLFPDSAAARGKEATGDEREEAAPHAIAFAHLMPGIHW
jgi:NAD(P)-dependent dehydrogenase (short-subunit alcohol dehydrogenase family)